MQLTMSQLREADNLDLGASDWFRIEQDRIHRFADATEDRQWIHLDVERARASPFGTTIAHGFLVLSLVPKLFFELAEFPDAGTIVNLGLDKVRFMSPVPSGAEVRLKARVLSARERSGGLAFRVRGTVELRDTGRRAMVAEVLFLAQPVPARET